ncbi:MAG: hypothetical protein IMF12_10370 [Proteobacteria bacterium]|nr:hypothetical protein [Pseudomonadota bacterium]
MIVKTRTPKVYVPRTDKSERNPFREENSRLKTDISRLKIEKAKLREENSTLRAENSQLNKESLQLKEEIHFANLELKEAEEYSELMDMELARNNALYHLLEEENLRSNTD